MQELVDARRKQESELYQTIVGSDNRLNKQLQMSEKGAVMIVLLCLYVRSD